MKAWMSTGGALLLAATVSACAGDSGNQSNNNEAAKPGDAAVGTAGSGSAAAGDNASNSARADMEFVQKQMAMGEAEIAMGQLAQKKGTHPEVKRFGEMMVRDHRMAGQDLKEVLANANNQTGTAAGTDSPRNTDEHGDHKEHMEELQKLSGREFDRQYIDQMVEDHEEALRDVERQAENATNPQVRQWAAKTLPKMQQHLERAKTIQETLEQGNNKGAKPRTNKERGQ